MQVSAEIRWFWQGEPPPPLEEWFCRSSLHPFHAGGGMTRVDEYLFDAGLTELGVKRRGGRNGIEVKGLVAARWGSLDVKPFAGPLELWAKWTSESLQLNAVPTVVIKKQRFLRKFSTAAQWPAEIQLDDAEQPLGKSGRLEKGCNMELTKIILPNQSVAWTLGLEAFGPIPTVEKSLKAVAAAIAARQPPALSGGVLSSYPVWLLRELTSKPVSASGRI